MKLLQLFVKVISILLLMLPVKANELTGKFTQHIKLQMQIQEIPAYAVLVFKGEKVLFERYFGLANIANKQRLNKKDVFLMASVSKMVTGAALLKLYDEGLFKLDDPINDYLPFEVNIPRHNTKVTFRMLLTHTSSIADGPAMDGQYYSGEDSPVKLKYFMSNYFSTDGEFYDMKHNFHEFNPGKVYNYSNIGSALIGVLVENIAKMSFTEYTRKNIFKPLGMDDSHWHLANIKTRIVTPYEDGKAVEHYTFTDYPNGGLRSHAQDMHKFLAMLGNGGNYKGAQILKPETTAEMFSQQIKKIDNSVGLHSFLIGYEDKIWGHEGGETGTSTIIGINPNNRVGVIILTNISDADLEDTFMYGFKLGEELDMAN